MRGNRNLRIISRSYHRNFFRRHISLIHLHHIVHSQSRNWHHDSCIIGMLFEVSGIQRHRSGRGNYQTLLLHSPSRIGIYLIVWQHVFRHLISTDHKRCTPSCLRITHRNRSTLARRHNQFQLQRIARRWDILVVHKRKPELGTFGRWCSGMGNAT